MQIAILSIYYASIYKCYVRFVVFYAYILYSSQKLPSLIDSKVLKRK